MKSQNISILIATVLFSLSCQVTKDVDDAANVRGGKCEIKKSVSSNIVTVLCFDFVDGYNSNTASTKCSDSTVTTDLDSIYNTSLGGTNGVSFTSGDSNSCDTSSTVGRCDITSVGSMYYYNNYWNAGTAQADCVGANLGGTWVP